MPARRLSLALALALAACGSSHPAPTAPAEPVPLPPASGSPISYLVDDATELGLSDAQLDKLRAIDGSLAAELDELDATDRAGHAPPPGATSGGGGGGHRGRHGGGMRGGGGMGGMGGGGMGGGGGAPSGGHGGRHGGTHDGAANASGSGGAPAAQIASTKEADVKDALARAFEVLDDNQRVKAQKILVDRGVDLAPNAPAKVEPPTGTDGATDDDSPVPDEP